MTVYEIVKDYLEKNGYTELCGDECACQIDDLMPCTSVCCLDCKPAYYHDCQKCEQLQECCAIGEYSPGDSVVTESKECEFKKDIK